MSSLKRTVGDIKTMKIQGARSIAIAGLKALKEIVEKNGFKKEFRRACKLLVSSRPTAVPLFNAIEKVKKEKNIEMIDNLIYYFENVCSVIASFGIKLIKKNSTVLTHCHSTVVVEMLRYTWEKNRKFKVIVTETRPLYQGVTTAKELERIGIPVTFIVDSASGFFAKDVDLMLFGYDAVRKEGIVNKIGSYGLAVLAKENKIPVYFVGETMKFDRRKKIEIEERSPEEVIKKSKLKKCEIRNPAFDVTPWKFVSGIITEKGILKPRKVLRMLK